MEKLTEKTDIKNFDGNIVVQKAKAPKSLKKNNNIGTNLIFKFHSKQFL